MRHLSTGLSEMVQETPRGMSSFSASTVKICRTFATEKEKHDGLRRRQFPDISREEIRKQKFHE